MISLKNLEALQQNLTKLSEGALLRVTNLSEESQNKLEWLKQGGRDFLQINRELILTVKRFGLAEIEHVLSRGEKISKNTLFDGFAKGLKAHLVRRFNNNGGDIHNMTPLTANWVNFKRKHGYFLTIGKMTGDLQKSIDNVIITTE